MRNKYFGYVFVTVLLLAGMTSAIFYIRGGNSTLPTWSGETIRVGYSSEPPYSMRLSDGTVSGEALVIAKAVLALMGVRDIRFVLLDFQKAIPALEEGQIDMIANGIFITSERAARVRFSLPFSVSRQGLLVARDNPLHLRSYADTARRPEITIAVLDGSVEQQTFMKLGVTGGRLFVVPEPSSGLIAVVTGKAQCLALTLPSLHWLAGEAPRTVAVIREPDEFLAVLGQSAFAFRPSDARLEKAVSDALRGYIGTPEHLKAVRRFGFGPESLPAWSRENG